MINDCTFLLSSYDGGEDLWDGFFTTLIDNWKDFNMPVVLNTETKNYSYPGLNIKTYFLCKEKKMTWSERLYNTLKLIETNYILLFLDDFWLDDKVDNVHFEKTFKWLTNDNDIASFSFYPMPGNNIDDKKYDRFELRPKICKYKLNCQAALWRKKILLNLLRKHEDPWEFEVNGSLRASLFYDYKFYSLKPNEKYVFSYGDTEIGCLIHRGKWNKDVYEKFIKKYSFNIDPNVRGFENWDEITKERKRRKNILGKIFAENIFVRLYRLYRKIISIL